MSLLIFQYPCPHSVAFTLNINGTILWSDLMLWLILIELTLLTKLFEIKKLSLLLYKAEIGIECKLFSLG